jgi:threonine dehydrogenase-like Zn-dependent dehydrogenase
MYGAGDVRVENVPDSVIKQPTDALVRVTAACICGSDLWPYHSMPTSDGPARMGHEFIGIVETACRANTGHGRQRKPQGPRHSLTVPATAAGQHQFRPGR